jgi:hypothetical protein
VATTCEFRFSVRDEDRDPVAVTSTGLPAGAVLTESFEPNPGYRSPDADRPLVHHYLISFKPTADQTGQYPVVLTASDGALTATRETTLEVEQEWEVYSMPGVQYITYQPRALLSSQGYQGASVEFLGEAWAHRNNKHGPSHGRAYVDLDLLFPTSGHAGNLYAYTLGTDLTLERNPSRRFLLPYFGAEIGGVHSSLLHDYFIAVPYAGLHVWADRNLWINVSGGYLLPGRNLDQLSGAFAKAGLNASFW